MMLPILLYHSVSNHASSRFRRWVISPDGFDAHLGYLKAHGYVPLTVTGIAQAVKDPGLQLPERVVCITFDDGFEDFYTDALPLLARHSFPATLYITSGFVGKTSRWLYGAGEGERQMLSWKQICEAVKQGIEIGAHSLHHLELDTLPPHQAKQEIETSKVVLEQNLERKIDSFAYPHGYHNRTVRDLVIQAGFTSACAVKHALSSRQDDPFALARIIVPGDAGPADLSRLLEGKGLPVVGGQEKPRTKIWRLVRRAIHLVRGNNGSGID